MPNLITTILAAAAAIILSVHHWRIRPAHSRTRQCWICEGPLQVDAPNGCCSDDCADEAAERAAW